MDPRERLRLALLGAGCTRCGRPYSAAGIRVLAQREEVAFVQLVCFACETQTLALVTGSPDGTLDRPSSGGSELFDPFGSEGAGRTGAEPDVADQPPRPDAAPVSRTDVRDMHAFLQSYRGDLRRLVETHDDGGGGR